MEGSKPKEVDVERAVGRANLQQLNKNGLNEKSRPVDFLKNFLLTKKIILSGKRKGILEKWTTCTNFRVVLANAGQLGSMHPNFTSFVAEEMQKHFGLHMFQVEIPS